MVNDLRPVGANRIPTLDGWRAVAIILVIADHAADGILGPLFKFFGATLDFSSIFPLKAAIGRAGVHIFFSLSGYLITARLLLEEQRQGSVSLGKFYTRRIFRIQPASVAYLVVVAALGACAVIDVSPTGWLAALFSVANIAGVEKWSTGHFWSLAVEEHFYLMWPLVFILSGRRNRIGATLGLAVLLSAWRLFVLKTGFSREWHFTVRTDMEVRWLLVGCLIALLEADAKSGSMLLVGVQKYRNLIITAALASLAAEYISADWKAKEILLAAAIIVTPTAILCTARAPDSRPSRMLESRVMRWLGKISFSLYLWQQLFVVFAESRSAAMGILQWFPLNIICALLCASLSYRYIETPALAVGHRLLRQG